jgi:hypothetical protein
MKNRSFLFSVAFVMLSVFSGGKAFATARIILNFKDETATIRANFNFFGEIREDDLKKATDTAQKLWSGLPYLENDHEVIPLELIVRGYHLKVKAELQMNILPSVAAAKEHAMKNQSPMNNYIRVEQTNKEFASATGSLGANAIHILYQDDLAGSTTLAHEFGHSMQLDHIQQAFTGIPRIMIERSFPAVEQKYKYNPEDPNSTINPRLRRVTQADMYDLASVIKKWPIEKEGDVEYVDIGWNTATKDKFLFREKMKRSFAEKWFGND